MEKNTFKIKAWLSAFRLRTLPLALASIGMGGFLAAAENMFDLKIFFFCILTTLFLQILSNLANDYGDYHNGADHIGRIGPDRAVQSGAISPASMKYAIILFVALSFFSGLYLLYISHTLTSVNTFGFFLAIGVLSIIASIKYTAGKNPYGYAGLGDISVLLFFGWVGVMGTYFLQTGKITSLILFPASACGFFSTAVLNVNNTRDIESDKMAGKMTIPVRVGPLKARIYHCILLYSGLLCAILFTIFSFKSFWQFLFLLALPMLILNAIHVYKIKDPKKLDPYLKQMALTTLVFVITFGIGLLIANK